MRFGDNRTEKNAAEGPIDRSANADEHGVERSDTHKRMCMSNMSKGGKQPPPKEFP